MDTLPDPRSTRPWTRVPYDWYVDADLYAREQTAIFRGAAWNYAALSAEIPRVGDFKTTTIGDAPIVVARAKDGSVTAVENRCAHRGVQFCYKTHGNVKAFQCPYHQWTYDLKGKLIGVPFRKGIAEVGGMPPDFDLANHPLTSLRVAEKNGTIFVSFDPNVIPFDDYLGPEIMPYFERIFDGRELTILGYERQLIESNWKLYMENLKDPYHASLLHVFFATFGLFRFDQPSWCTMDKTGRHSIMAVASRGGQASSDVTKDMKQFRSDLTLKGPELIQPVPEFPGKAVGVMQAIWPNLVIQQQSNTLAMRQIVTRDANTFELHWTFFGFADDDAAMTARRLRQANLVGTSGYVSMDDAEVLEFSQKGARPYATARGVLEMGGMEVDDQDHHITEVPVRAFWKYYREVMGL